MKQPTAFHSLFIFIFVLILFTLLSELIGTGSSRTLLWMVLLPVGVMVLLPAVYAYYQGFNLKRTFHLTLPSFRTCLVALIVGISGLFIINQINFLLTLLFTPYTKMSEENLRSLQKLAEYDTYWFYLSIVLIPAFCEEFLFRGFILTGLVNSAGRIRAVVLTALLFGLMHQMPPQILIVSLIGILCGALLVLTNSLLIPIIIHFLNNAVVVFFLPKPGDIPIPPDTMGLWDIELEILVLCLFIIGLFWLIKNRPNDSDV